MFSGLASIVSHLAAPNLEVDVVATSQEQVRRHEGGKAWRRNGWVVDHRALLDVIAVSEFRPVADITSLLPNELVDPFTTADLAHATTASLRTARQMVYCLREIGSVVQIGTRGRAPEYSRARPAP